MANIKIEKYYVDKDYYSPNNVSLTSGISGSVSTSGLSEFQVISLVNTNPLILAYDASSLLGYKPIDFALASHNHSTSNITSGVLGVARGGTGISGFGCDAYLRSTGTTTLTEYTPAEVLADIGAASSTHNHTFASLTSKPTTLAGYGITDAASSSHSHTITAITGVRTENQNDAGLQVAQSGFLQASSPVNFPTGASGWWHLLSVRHTSTSNNYAMQMAGSFFDQDFYVRKTNNSATTAWKKISLDDHTHSYLPLAGGTLTGTLTTRGITLGSGYSILHNNTPSKSKIMVWNSTNYSIGMTNGLSYGGLGGSSSTDYAMTFQMNDTSTRGWWWGGTGMGNSNGAMALTVDGRLTLANSMRIGYGISDTTPPGTYNLDISGTVRATSTMLASNFILSSDYRLKEQVQPIVEDLSDIQLIQFKYRNDTSRKRYGVIAQQIVDKHPEFVYEDNDGYLQVAYIDLLVAKMAEMEKEMKEMNKRIKKLENK